MVKKVEKKGLKSHNIEASLSPVQKEIVHLLTDEFLTVKQISQRRGVSLQATYKVIKKIKKKGAYDGGLNRVEKVETTFNKSDIRLHGQEFNIKIIWQDDNYQRLLEKSNTLFQDSNTIRLYKNSVEIYSGQSFFGKTTNIADKKSFDYWERFFSRIEHELKIIIKKQKSRNIKEVNHHYARGDSEVCENAEENRERIWVYAEEDGKLAFITDDSFGFKEDECVHPITAKKDRDAIDKQVNDWRLNNPPTNSQIAIHIADNARNMAAQTQAITANAGNLDQYAIHLKAHVQSVKDLGAGVKKQNEIFERIAKALEEKK